MRSSRLVAALASFLLLAACSDAPTSPATSPALRADAPPGHSMAGGNKQLAVMTRNVYLGADIAPIFSAPNPIVLFDRVNTGWLTVQASLPAERMARIADEIVAANPELVGLQEVTTYYTQSPGDAFLGASQTQATNVAYDFLAELTEALAARGARYDVVSLTRNSDIELYALPLGQPIGAGYDVRLVDHDVILARADVKTSNPQHGLYAAYVPLGAYRQVRGWASVDVKHRGETVRFLDTHLENAVAIVQQLQTQQLLAITAASPMPVIVVGDPNSPPDGSFTSTYAMMRAAGFSDAWDAGTGPGFTCCHAADLRNAVSTLHTRIDLVLFRGALAALEADVIGEEPDDRTASGLWPSDHAGVTATLRLLNPKFVE